MKTKLITFTVIATLIIVATVAMASGGLISGSISESDFFEPSFDRLADFMGYDTEEKFEEFHKTALFMGKYCTTKDSFSFIENMILSGCDAQTTMDIYQFYLTTNEPISIVKQIYDMVYTGEPIKNRDVVFENAFNKLTDNKCGVLTEESVITYLEKGLSVDDISEANVLSRKGVMTIQEILDALLQGSTWESIIETVSGEEITVSDTNETVSIASTMTYAAVTNQNLNSALSENEEDYHAQIAEKVNNTLKQKGYWKGRKSENYDLLVKDAKSKGISEAKLVELFDKGCSEVEIINILNDPACTAKTIDIIAENEVIK